MPRKSHFYRHEEAEADFLTCAMCGGEKDAVAAAPRPRFAAAGFLVLVLTMVMARCMRCVQHLGQRWLREVLTNATLKAAQSLLGCPVRQKALRQ